MKTLLSLCLLTLACVPTMAAEPAAGSKSARQPNVLWIMSDDHAAHAIGAYGGRFADLNPTPTIDSIARQGAVLENCFCTNSICTPSRATIITGRYSHQNGVKTLQGSIPAALQTMPRVMKAAGYETAIIGKWHLEAEPAAFDFYTVLPGQGSYFNPIFRTRGPRPWPNNTFRVAGGDSTHSADAITDLSLRWLRNRKHSDQPFFLMHHFKSPHDNFENAERYDFKYADDTMPAPDSLRVRGNHGPLGRAQYGTSVGMRNTRRNMGHHMFVDPTLDSESYLEESYQRYLKKYLRTVRGVDDNIARLIEELKSSGQYENTVVVYTSDQGFMLGEHDYIDKRWMYEESLRMPMIVRYPGKIPAGSRHKFLANNVDFAPTLFDLVGIDPTSVSDTPPLSGRSFYPMLTGDEVPSDWPSETYYRYWMHMAHHDNPAHVGIRTADRKLIYFYGLPLDAAGAMPTPTEPYWEYYDLAADPHEMNNLIETPDRQDEIAAMKIRLQQKCSEVGDTWPEK